MFDFDNLRPGPEGALLVNRKVVCGHCGNECVVMLDRPREALAPCPMCRGGAVRNRQAEDRGDAHWSSQEQVDQCSWEGGLTSQHLWLCASLYCRELVASKGAACSRHGGQRSAPPPYPGRRQPSPPIIE